MPDLHSTRAHGFALPSVLIPGVGGPPDDLAFSPDGRLIAGSFFADSSWLVFLWDVASGRLAGPPLGGHGNTAPWLEFAPNGLMLAITDLSTAHLRSLVTTQPVYLPENGLLAWTWKRVQFTPDGSRMATLTQVTRASGFAATQVQLWRLDALQPLTRGLRISLLPSEVLLRFSPNGRFLLAGGEGGLFVCDTAAPAPAFRRMRGYTGTASKAALSADGTLLAAENYADRDVHLLHTTTREVLTRYRCDAFVTELAFSPAGQVLAAALVSQSYKSGTIDLWTTVTDPASRIRLAGMDSPIAQLTFSPDARFLAATAEPARHEDPRQVRLWDVASARPGSPIEAAGQVGMAFSPDSRWFAMSCADRAVRLWDTRAPGPELDLTDPDPHEGRPLLAFSPTGGHLATTTRTGVRLWTLP